MSFGGNFGPVGNLVPFGIIKNILGEQASGYTPDGKIKFMTPSGREYTPDRIDTLVILGFAVQGNPPLAAVVPGNPSTANADTGILVTAAPSAPLSQHGLPANFGPGRGKWADVTGRFPRLRVTASAAMAAPVVPLPPPPGGGPVAAMFFGISGLAGNPDYTAPIAPGAEYPFPQNGPTTGAGAPTRIGAPPASAFLINTPGLYEISYEATITEAAQMEVLLNGLPVPTGRIGRATGTSIIGTTLLLNLVNGDVIRIFNPAGNATTLTTTPDAGGAAGSSVASTLVIKMVGGGGSSGTSVGGTGGVDTGSIPSGPNDVAGGVRNYNAVDLSTLFLTVECVHSVQG